eukprot:Blabericola_migrator_1__4011@NODE_2219_length_3107_cov_26_714145_g1398_i0_p2_GENE_NODE_2219_length_3107_cov_26_714145_g1398_i0NODE_2219_length_3107_cov_26_714145_g1398_i0_p2_ORF_typecomplete_len114_score7_00_NODE_2219_length_3107_cov_26_714145_g1398_i08711212
MGPVSAASFCINMIIHVLCLRTWYLAVKKGCFFQSELRSLASKRTIDWQSLELYPSTWMTGSLLFQAVSRSLRSLKSRSVSKNMQAFTSAMARGNLLVLAYRPNRAWSSGLAP